MDDVDGHVAVMQELKEVGVSLALDDFGKGYSSLSYLHRFPIDRIKVDRDFVRGLPDSRADRAIVSAVLSFAGALDMEVVAEGVETQQHVDALRELGCEYVQGFFFHRHVKALGTDFELISEERARDLRPSSMVVLPWYFKKEIIAREADYLRQGGKLLFPMPYAHVVTKDGEIAL